MPSPLPPIAQFIETKLKTKPFHLWEPTLKDKGYRGDVVDLAIENKRQRRIIISLSAISISLAISLVLLVVAGGPQGVTNFASTRGSHPLPDPLACLSSPYQEKQDECIKTTSTSLERYTATPIEPADPRYNTYAQALTMLAAIKKDTSSCLKLTTQWKEACDDAVNVADAYLRGESAVCLRAKNLNIKEICTIDVATIKARRTGDASICDVIPHVTDRVACRNSVQST